MKATNLSKTEKKARKATDEEAKYAVIKTLKEDGQSKNDSNAEERKKPKQAWNEEITDRKRASGKKLGKTDIAKCKRQNPKNYIHLSCVECILRD